MLEWLIIGGGVHGTHLSHVLTSRAGWSRHKVRVLDPHAAPLARWQQMTENVGMAFMRSSFVHHIGLEPRGLERFAETPDGAAVARFAHPFRRPSYALFQRHAQAVADEHKLGDLRLQGRALGLTATKRGWRVETDAGPVDTKRVLLALGLSEQPCWPAWARQLRSAGANVHHLFEAGFRRTDLRDWTRAVVVGGGISAAQAALALANHAPEAIQSPETVTVLSRHPARAHQLDSDPGWLGPKRLLAFHRQPCPARRRTAINQARHRGSMPPDVKRRLGYAHRMGRLTHHVAGVRSAVLSRSGLIRLNLDRAPGSLAADLIVLGTGFEARRPGGPWLNEAIETHSLPVCQACGYPIVDTGLQWAENLFVTGPLAELEIGPVSRNIAGARLAAERLVYAA